VCLDSEISLTLTYHYTRKYALGQTVPSRALRVAIIPSQRP